MNIVQNMIAGVGRQQNSTAADKVVMIRAVENVNEKFQLPDNN